MTAIAHQLHGFNVFLQAEDDAGVFFVTLGCAAVDAAQAEMLALGQAQAEGWTVLDVEEVWTPDGAHDLPDAPAVLGVTERDYAVEGAEDDGAW